MDVTTALDLGRQALMLTLLIAAPLLIVAMVVGVLVSILQAVTQIQEMTLTFVPKIVAMVLAGVALMPWVLNRLMAYATEMFGPIQLP
jgi:flagellar biosynthesis protein FliQ